MSRQEPGDLMTVAEWGQRIGVSRTSAHRRVVAGDVEVVNVGSRRRPQLRITESAHAAYLANRKVAV